MCQTCGCTVVGPIAIHDHHHAHAHAHAILHSHDDPLDHDHPHPHDPLHPELTPTQSTTPARSVDLVQSVLSKNDRLAERNRGFFLAKGIFVLNLLSSPGAGKTTLIERTLRDLGTRLLLGRDRPLRSGVIVGDLATDADAQRIGATGAPAIQITTGTTCHLEADMIAQAMGRLDLDALDLLIIENVGNLVCPAAYDLGETLRVVLMSVTEGEDKPLKYPPMFKSADLVLLTKVDIAEAVGFDRDRALTHIQRTAPQATLLEVSARSGQGMDDWYAFLGDRVGFKP